MLSQPSLIFSTPVDLGHRTMVDNSPKVLIAGAGPSGLILALCLSKQGVPVRVIEKEQLDRIGRRGSGITPRSLEVFDALGVLDDVLKLADKPVPMRSYELPGGVVPLKTWSMSPTFEPTPALPYRNAVFLGQDQVEGILRKHLARLGCEVELGTELVSFSQKEDAVEAIVRKNSQEELVIVPWLVGADGAKGVTRKQLKLDFLGETRTQEKIVVGDVYLKGLDTEHVHMWTKGPAHLILIWPGQQETGDLFSIQMAADDDERKKIVSEPNYFIDFFRSTTGRNDIEFGKMTWKSDTSFILLEQTYSPNIRMVDTFGEGRVFIVGDAAHVHSLMGGQGMNSSIQDSFNLGWKLAYVIKGISNPDLLSTYTEERLPVIAEMLDKTSQIHKKTFQTGTFDDAQHWQRTGSLDQLGVNYRWSSIVVQDETPTKDSVIQAYGDGVSGIRAGDRAPDAPDLHPVDQTGPPVRIFQLLTYSQHTILIFSPSAEDIHEINIFIKTLPPGITSTVAIFDSNSELGQNVEVDLTLRDKSGHAHTGYSVEKGTFTIILVRPDRMIGAITSSVEGLKKYFNGIFRFSDVV
ncbi:monooxygenase [Hysterangium stoloniferum]|nr:monooxygenase [Hysterangium stoloniferum]